MVKNITPAILAALRLKFKELFAANKALIKASQQPQPVGTKVVAAPFKRWESKKQKQMRIEADVHLTSVALDVMAISKAVGDIAKSHKKIHEQASIYVDALRDLSVLKGKLDIQIEMFQALYKGPVSHRDAIVERMKSLKQNVDAIVDILHDGLLDFVQQLLPEAD